MHENGKQTSNWIECFSEVMNAIFIISQHGSMNFILLEISIVLFVNILRSPHNLVKHLMLKLTLSNDHIQEKVIFRSEKKLLKTYRFSTFWDLIIPYFLSNKIPEAFPNWNIDFFLFLRLQFVSCVPFVQTFLIHTTGWPRVAVGMVFHLKNVQ